MGFKDELERAKQLISNLRVELDELGAEQPVLIDVDSLDNAKDALEQAKKNAEILKDAIYNTNKELEGSAKRAGAFDKALGAAQKRFNSLPKNAKELNEGIKMKRLNNPFLSTGSIFETRSSKNSVTLFKKV